MPLNATSYTSREDDVLLYYPTVQAAIDAAASDGYFPAQVTSAGKRTPDADVVCLRRSEGRDRKPEVVTELSADQVSRMDSVCCVNVDQCGEYQFGPRLMKSTKRPGQWYLRYGR